MNKKKPEGKQKGSAQKKVDWKALEIVHPDAAGIDVGGSEHWVAVSPDRDAEPVRRFGPFTADLHEMARWLVEKGVRSVAMQSTGVGRKSDVEECQWLLKLHAFGLLNNSFQPTDEIRIARTLWRQRGNLVAEASSAIQRMQKVLTEMNVQLSNVLSDISGVSGMKIIGLSVAPTSGVVRIQGKGGRNTPQFDLRTELYRIIGIDWSQIDGIDILTAQTVIAEAGADLSAFPSEKQFAS